MRKQGDLGDDVRETAARLRQTLGQEAADATKPCGLQGGDAVPPHSGQCCQCSGEHDPVFHSIPRPEAEQEALKLMAELDALRQQNGNIGSPEAAVGKLFENGDSGTMMGVLVCLNDRGEKVVLKAFSGYFDETSIRELEGWCPPVPVDNPAELERLRRGILAARDRAGAARSAIDGIAAKTAESKQAWEAADAAAEQELTRIGRQQLTEEEWAKLGLAKAKYKPGSPEYAKIAQVYDALKEKRKGAKDAFAQLAEQGESRIAELQRELAAAEGAGKVALAAYRNFENTHRQIENFAGTPKLLGDAKCGAADEELADLSPNRLGTCAAPKLLAEARRLGLTPVSMAEFFYGHDTATKTSKSFYQSCDHCRSILGHALHGLEDQQKRLLGALEKQ